MAVARFPALQNHSSCECLTLHWRFDNYESEEKSAGTSREASEVLNIDSTKQGEPDYPKMLWPELANMYRNDPHKQKPSCWVSMDLTFCLVM